MTDRNFAATRQRVFAAHQSGDYAAGMHLAEQAAADFPDRVDQPTYWLACFNALLGAHETALETLEDGERRGLWWAHELLENDPDLESIRGDPRFEAIVVASKEARAASVETLPSEPVVQIPQLGPPQATLVLIHGRSEAADDIAIRWAPAERALIVAPRSSQLSGMQTMQWDDVDRAEADVRRGLQLASAHAQVLARPMVVGGFSQGAGLAIWLAVMQRLDGLAGFIAVAPSAAWARELIDSAHLSLHGLRGHISIGDLDPRLDDCKLLTQALRDAGAEIRLELVEGLGHDYPPDFADNLPDVLSWVGKREEGGGSA